MRNFSFPFILLFLGFLASAAEFKDPPGIHTAVTTHFIAPNEKHPEKFEPHLLGRSPPGPQRRIVVSVGSERSFLTAGMDPNAGALLIVDRDAEVIRFSKLNAKLLRVSSDLPAYRKIRLEWDFESWRQLDPALTRNDWDWWKTHVRDQASFKGFHDLDSRSFSGVNYLHDETRFQRIKKLADAREIHAVQINLTHEDQVIDLIKQIKKNGYVMDVLDLSNAWDVGYMMETERTTLLKYFESIADESSVLLRTEVSSSRGTGDLWEYVGTSFKEIFETPATEYTALFSPKKPHPEISLKHLERAIASKERLFGKDVHDARQLREIRKTPSAGLPVSNLGCWLDGFKASLIRKR